MTTRRTHDLARARFRTTGDRELATRGQEPAHVRDILAAMSAAGALGPTRFRKLQSDGRNGHEF